VTKKKKMITSFHKLLLFGAILHLTIVTGFSQQDTLSSHIRVYSNGRVGFVGRTGKLAFAASFTGAGDFDNVCRCALARNDEKKWGIIDTKGHWMVKPRFYVTGALSEGWVSVKEDRFYKFIGKDGKVLVGGFDGAKDFSEGLAPIIVGAKWGYLDLLGNIAIEPRYEYVGPFVDGVADVELDGQTSYIHKDGTTFLSLPAGIRGVSIVDGRAVIWRGEKYGISDEIGNIIVSPKYGDIKEFSEGLAAFRTGIWWGYLDRDGIVSIMPVYDRVGSFADGLAPAKDDRKWGYIDKTGAWYIQPVYDDANSFHGGIALVELNGESFFIDTSGQKVFRVSNELFSCKTKSSKLE
jgi:WG containing repeat